MIFCGGITVETRLHFQSDGLRIEVCCGEQKIETWRGKNREKKNE